MFAVDSPVDLPANVDRLPSPFPPVFAAEGFNIGCQCRGLNRRVDIVSKLGRHSRSFLLGFSLHIIEIVCCLCDKNCEIIWVVYPVSAKQREILVCFLRVFGWWVHFTPISFISYRNDHLQNTTYRTELKGMVLAIPYLGEELEKCPKAVERALKSIQMRFKNAKAICLAGKLPSVCKRAGIRMEGAMVNDTLGTVCMSMRGVDILAERYVSKRNHSSPNADMTFGSKTSLDPQNCTISVLGGGGFIGKEIVSQLSARYAKIIALDSRFCGHEQGIVEKVTSLARHHQLSSLASTSSREYANSNIPTAPRILEGSEATGNSNIPTSPRILEGNEATGNEAANCPTPRESKAHSGISTPRAKSLLTPEDIARVDAEDVTLNLLTLKTDHVCEVTKTNDPSKVQKADVVLVFIGNGNDVEPMIPYGKSKNLLDP